MRRMSSLGDSEGREWRSGGAWKTGVAPTASLEGMRRSEKMREDFPNNYVLSGTGFPDSSSIDSI